VFGLLCKLDVNKVFVIWQASQRQSVQRKDKIEQAQKKQFTTYRCLVLLAQGGSAEGQFVRDCLRCLGDHLRFKVAAREISLSGWVFRTSFSARQWMAPNLRYSPFTTKLTRLRLLIINPKQSSL
jgi:hypothetical protein